MHRQDFADPPNGGNNRDNIWRNRRRNNDPEDEPGPNNPRRPRGNENQQFHVDANNPRGPRGNHNRQFPNDGHDPRVPRYNQNQRNNQPRPQQNRGGGNNRRLNNSDQSNRLYFGFTRLNELSNMNSDEVIAILAQRKNDFEELLHNITRPDLLVVTLRVLANVCQASFASIGTLVLSNACSATFLKTLDDYLRQLPFESPIEKMKNKLYHEDRSRFWSNLMKFFKKIMELLPNTARDELTEILRKITPICISIGMNQDYKVDKNVQDEASSMFKELEEEIRKVKEKNEKRATFANEPAVEADPPEDFRLLSVIPTVEDLFDQNPFIRPCIIKDCYNSVEHYLDVQFRLLREDFISPLRSGIQEYLHGQQKNRSNELRIYRKVKLISPEVAKNKVGIAVFFGIMKNVIWARSKRFMYGGLLLLSNDNFNSILFVTVADRSDEQLKQGCILINPCQGTTITREMYDTDFVMLESKIYFEPYMAVLSAMQHMNAENFPMEKYLVNADTSTALPRYLVTGQVLQYKHLNLPIGEGWAWPTAADMSLDETQYRAFKFALTQEFAVIQGPPGTGKTFIALEIVRTLLENRRYWEPHGPIIVVCLTNHALDQFLEGILKHTNSIIRIGSRSKSEALKPYTLMERRKLTQFHRRTGAWSVMCETQRELEGNLSLLQKIRLSVKHLTTPDAIVPLSILREYCHDEGLSEIKSNDGLVNWLVGRNIASLPEVPAEQQQRLDEMMQVEAGLEDDPDRHMDDELELNYQLEIDNSSQLIFPLKSMDVLIEQRWQQLLEYRDLAANTQQPLPLMDPTIEWEEDLNTLNVQRLSLQRKLAQHPILTQQRYPPRDHRWRVYWQWVRKSYNNAMIKISELETTYREIDLKLNEAKQLVDLSVLKEYNIVGLTTSAAAKLHASLRALRAPIVLVEEAAEILEAHVVCSMTKHCQHVILIGDHKQLRPKASVYKLGTKYNLNISLFERMVNIRGDCAQLAHQHRMRPQIAKLITPSIYEVLHNHESVYKHPSVKGLRKNLFFLNHDNRESSHNNEESWVNQHEAVFLVAFARHLIMQGYDGSGITILCTYTGQLFALMQESRRYAILKHVRVTSVDNYQGEENKIILLSLVRNNGEGNIGFLKEENRVCVALSRAREGLYIMGNMDDLVVKNDIWPKIKQVLEEQNAIGDSLELQCQIHSDQITQIRALRDFQQSPEGGCLLKCNSDLPCGHSCTSICHILDREHEEYRCGQPCVKNCPYDHPCPLKCSEGCKPCEVMVERKLKCDHDVLMYCSTDPAKFDCYIQIKAILPNCQHEVDKPCHRDVSTIKCPYPCPNRLPCGHTCRLKCHVTADPDHIEYQCFKDCTKNNIDCSMNNHPCKKRCYEECVPCPILIEKKRSCGHHYKKIQCAINVEAVQCERPCNRVMSCDHKCKQKCWEECGNCQQKVKKQSSCGHTVQVKCCEEATTSKCNGQCQKKLVCGHPCTAKCKDKCVTVCETMVRRTQPGSCGHIFSVPCHLANEPSSQKLLRYCDEPCGADLACEHRCGGKCGECKQGRIHIPCTATCGRILVCGHKCDTPCSKACPPCNKPCELECAHSKCNSKCGMPCTPCNEPCTWTCEHRKCEKLCSELCDIKPCYEACKLSLKCDHPCVGFCGEPCPPLCRICDEEELTDIFFGNEGEPDARFIYLEDCKHCIESNALERWVTEASEANERGSQEVQMKSCPRCKTPIRKCLRIMNDLKKHMTDVIGIKQKLFGIPAVLKDEQLQLLETIKTKSEDRIVAALPELQSLMQDLLVRGLPVRKQRRQILNERELDAFRIVLQIVDQILNILNSIKTPQGPVYELVKNQVAMLVDSVITREQISNQELDDISLELRRLNYMAEVCDMNLNNAAIIHQKEYKIVMVKLSSIEKFTEHLESGVKMAIQKAAQQIGAEIIEERKMIVKAISKEIGFRSGHWFKCPNGHFYVITECGGAMEMGKCNECGARIGGGSHRLLSDNALASEMDGATRQAWPGGLY